MCPAPHERIVFERAPDPVEPTPLWIHVALGVVAGGIILFALWFGYQKYQEYRVMRALEAAANAFQGSMEQMSEQSRKAAIERRRALEAQNQARHSVWKNRALKWNRSALRGKRSLMPSGIELST